MAVRANSLTDRATPPETRIGAMPTLPAGDLRVFIEGLRQLGYDARALTEMAGFPAVDLDDPDARIPCDAYGTLISSAQRTRFTPNLALELARVTPIGAYPLLDYLILTSPTVGAGVHQLAKYLQLVGNPVVITIDERGDPVRVEIGGDASPFSIEYSAALLVLDFGRETDGVFKAAGVSFRHAPDDVRVFERVLGCEVRTMTSWNGVTIGAEAWRVPMPRRDPVLRQVLERQADDILARLPSRTGLAVDVQRALTKRVAGGDTRIGTLARELAMSGRTLQRRLAAEGVSYQDLLDDARKEAAGRYLHESPLAIGEVAYLVGYSEPAPFHRAFKRWYGVTPEAFRQTRRVK
jgi:AraC-like DNA-binding protein